MNAQQYQQAEQAYVLHNKSLAQISQQLNIPQEDLSDSQDVWEFRRQAYRTAEYFFCQQGKTFAEISQFVPLTEQELETYRDVLEAKRQAYLRNVPSALLDVRMMLDKRIQTIAARPNALIPTSKLRDIFLLLKPTATLLDQYEILLNILLHHFLPTQAVEQGVIDQFIAFLEEFRGFLKLQIFSGNK